LLDGKIEQAESGGIGPTVVGAGVGGAAVGAGVGGIVGASVGAEVGFAVGGMKLGVADGGAAVAGTVGADVGPDAGVGLGAEAEVGSPGVVLPTAMMPCGAEFDAAGSAVDSAASGTGRGLAIAATTRITAASGNPNQASRFPRMRMSRD
jgi:hypothetical protein